jgi:type IV secretory pathway TraG/TraD family ATPase VirD4
VGSYIFDQWPAFDERPRSIVEMMWSGMADKFLYNPLNRIFCGGKCDFTPEDTTHRNKIIICDWPLLEYGHETGRTINIILKLIFQRAWLRRKLSESPNPVILWQDESQYFIVPKWDNFFQQTCRGSRVAVVCLTQNILNLSEQLGEQTPGSKTKSFLGNLAIKIFHQQNETETCQYAADQIGKHWVYVDQWSAGSSEGHTHTNFSGNKQLVHIVEPLEFQKLSKPDGQNPMAQAIVYKSGETFKANNKNYLPVHFSREI